jgi:hypothetical protein
MKDPTKLHIFLSKISNEQTEQNIKKRKARRRLLLIFRSSKWKKKVVITNSLGDADIGICFCFDTLKSIKDIRESLHCIVPHEINTHPHKGGSKMDFFDLEYNLELILIGFDLRTQELIEV